MTHMNTDISHGRSFASSWRQVYERAILELDGKRLPGRIAAARPAIFDRAEEILTKPSGGENHELHDALRALRLLEEAAVRERAPAYTALAASLLGWARPFKPLFFFFEHWIGISLRR